jgi:LacI family transcriptional regulator
MANLTQKQIAEKIGISQSLVSLILSGKRKVETKLHNQILEATQQLNYIPNHAALSLKTGRRQAWGLFFPSFGNLADFNRQIVQGIWEIASENAYTLSVTCLQSPEPDANEYMKFIREGRFDGIFMIYESEKRRIPFEEIHRLKVNTVVVNCPLPHELPHCVYSDGQDGVYQAVKHLIKDHNRKRIAYAFRDRNSWLMEDRFAGYLKALKEFDLPVDEKLIIPTDKNAGYEKNGEQAVEFLLKQGTSFDAIYCPADYIAIGAMGALHRREVKIPDEVAIIGFDNHHSSGALYPRLTTVGCDGVGMGQKAAQIMLETLDNEEDTSIRTFKMPVSLVVRESCGCVAQGC